MKAARGRGSAGGRERTLAVGYDLRHMGGDLTFAVARSYTDLICALVEREEWQRLAIVATPYAPRRQGKRLADRPTVRKILGRAPPSLAVELTDYPSLAASARPVPTVMHEGSWQDLVTPFRFRRLCGGDFPVTVSHHGHAPRQTLWSFGIDLLFCDSRPHDAVLCTSRASRSVIEGYMEYTSEVMAANHGVRPRFRGRLEVVPLGVDTRAFAPRPKRPLRERFGLAEEAIVLLFLGRFDFVGKADLLPLLRVLRGVADDNPGAELLLVVAGGRGRPAEEEMFRRFAAELGLAGLVRRLADLAPGDDALLHATADVFVCPVDGVFENFGLAPVQAMASGVPQVASDWDGYRETIVHGETGFLVPTLWGPCDPALSLRTSFLDGVDGAPLLGEATAIDLRAFREHVSALVRSRELREEMGRRSRERALAQFSLESVAARHAALWGELCARARARPTRPRPWADVFDAPLLQLYRGHVTEVLDDGARLRISEAGVRAFEGAEAMPLLDHEPSALEIEIVRRVLGDLAGARGASGRKAGVVVRGAARACRRGRDAVWSNVLWLLKYGYLELDGGARDAAPLIPSSRRENGR